MNRCPECHRRIMPEHACPDHGVSPSTLPIPPALEHAGPPRVAGFTAGALLGAGGSAMVWAATRDLDGAPVALKVGRADSPLLVERFHREAEAMERIGPPHVPELYQRGRLAGGQPYIAMERLFGDTLAALLAALAGPPALTWVMKIAIGVLEALAVAHARGVIHRDLKPENIAISAAEGRVVLLDFGLTRRRDGQDAELTRRGVILGTPEYMAPEQLRDDRELDAQADIYSFGVLLFELLTLRPPFVGDRSSIEHGHQALRPPRPSDLVSVPEGLEGLVFACLSKDPRRRPPGAIELLRAIATASESPAEEATPAARATSGARLGAERRHPVVIAMVETSGDVAPVMAAITRRGGFLSRQQGRRCVAVFSGFDTEHPARAALSAARELVDHGARTALHLAVVTLRRKERGAPSVYGSAVDRPETWLPSEPWSGIKLTAEIAQVLLARDPEASSSAVPAAPLPATELGEGSTEIQLEAPLLGADSIIAELAASLRASFDEGRPTLLTLLGEHGLGKTRIAGEAARLSRAARPEALVVHLAAEPFSEHGASPLAEHLGRQLGAPFSGAAEGSAPSHHLRMRTLAGALRERALRGPVAVILDDAHWAPGDVLDALEYASLDGAGGSLWVVVAAHPRFEQARPAWGARTAHHARIALSPLADAAAMQLAAALLRPVEYPPAAVLERLVRWSGGNPFSLAEIVRTLKRAGIVRRRPNVDSFYLATADLDALPPSPAWQWIAARRLSSLSPELAAFTRLCAVLGATFSRAALERIQDAVERAGGAGTLVDVGFGLAALVDEAILERGADERYAFRNNLFQDAVSEMLDPAQRASIHRAAFAHWRSQASSAGLLPGRSMSGQPDGVPPDPPAEILELMARHAKASGERDEAAAAYLQLADLSFSKHRHVDADLRYEAALAATSADDTHRRALSLAGRGKSRVYIGRVREAAEDLAAARQLAAELGDIHLLAELLLEEATVLDWAAEFDLSAKRLEEAGPLVDALGVEVLRARLKVAQGRTAWRRGQVRASIDLLEQGLAAAVRHDDYAGRVIALLMLAFQLSSAGQLEQAEARFQEVIDLTEAVGDRPHLCIAHLNRNQLWVARKEPARALEDLRRAVALAREIGNPAIERMALYNVAELLHWSDRKGEALELARRGRMLEARFFDRKVAWGALLTARILVDVGEHEEAQRLVSWVKESSPSDLSATSDLAPSLNAFFRMLQLVLVEVTARSPGALAAAGDWDEPVAMAERGVQGGVMAVEDLLEILHWRARLARQGGRTEESARALEQAGPWLAKAPLWRARFEELGVVANVTGLS